MGRPTDNELAGALYEATDDDRKRYLRALRAIKARINGVYDDPDLMSFWPLMPSARRDIERIIDMTLGN